MTDYGNGECVKFISILGGFLIVVYQGIFKHRHSELIKGDRNAESF
jgi:hypothetical protein